MPSRSFVFVLALLSGQAVWAEGRIDINAADAATLDDVMAGVGPIKAEAIVLHRQEHGPFRHIDDLIEVKGIGEKTVERNRDLITVGPAESIAPPEQ
jgi:competence protein ComEA